MRVYLCVQRLVVCVYCAMYVRSLCVTHFRWYAGFYILWTLSHSATAVPYAALTPEICYRCVHRSRFTSPVRVVQALQLFPPLSALVRAKSSPPVTATARS